MKTDREWIRETMADAVADLFWERMKQPPQYQVPKKILRGCMSPIKGFGIIDGGTSASSFTCTGRTIPDT